MSTIGVVAIGAGCLVVGTVVGVFTMRKNCKEAEATCERLQKIIDKLENENNE